ARYLTPAMSSRRRLAMLISALWYLSERYTISLMPLWMMLLAHSLQGKRVTYTRAPRRSLWAEFKIALSSAWQTYIYFVSSGGPSRSQGISSSLQPVGIPLYPKERILFSGLTMQAPTWLLLSLDRMAESRAMPMKYSSQLI